MLGTQIDGADPSNTMEGSTYGDRTVVKEGDVDEEKNKAVLMASFVSQRAKFLLQVLTSYLENYAIH